MKLFLFMLFGTLILSILRILGERDEIFQAAAHCWVTWLLCAWYYRSDDNSFMFALWLIIVEIVCGVFGLHLNIIKF